MRHELEKILYVEDDPDIAAIAQLALETVGGFNVMVCDNGRAALEAAASFRPDLFLLDVMMPDMDGPGVLAALRQMPDVGQQPAIFMTAKVQPGEVARYRALGAIGVISKPFDPMTVADEIRDIWATAATDQGGPRP